MVPVCLLGTYSCKRDVKLSPPSFPGYHGYWKRSGDRFNHPPTLYNSICIRHCIEPIQISSWRNPSAAGISSLVKSWNPSHIAVSSEYHRKPQVTGKAAIFRQIPQTKDFCWISLTDKSPAGLHDFCLVAIKLSKDNRSNAFKTFCGILKVVTERNRQCTAKGQDLCTQMRNGGVLNSATLSGNK